MLMSWLVNFIEPEISQTYVFYTRTIEIWETSNLTYSHLSNDAQLYNLKQTTNGASNIFVIAYYNVLNSLYQEM